MCRNVAYAAEIEDVGREVEKKKTLTGIFLRDVRRMRRRWVI